MVLPSDLLKHATLIATMLVAGTEHEPKAS